MVIREMCREECLRVLAGARLARLACAHENQPYVVPVYLAYDQSSSGEACLYGFTTLGQKVAWMRANPLVCVEVDDIKNQFEWTSLVVFGRYEELPGTPEFEAERTRAYELLSRHALWWQPAYVAGSHHAPAADGKPIYFRIFIDKITGHRAVSDKSSPEPNGGKIVPKIRQHWFSSFWKS